MPPVKVAAHSTYGKAADFPLVVVGDDGIRPAGPKDACFYCGRRVGEEHGRDCVTVVQRVELFVRVKDRDGRALSGLWQVDEPHSWHKSMIEFFLNEGSWCASNLEASEVVWDRGSEDAPAVLERLHRDNGCLCELVAFDFVRVVDAAARRRNPPFLRGLSPCPS